MIFNSVIKLAVLVGFVLSATAQANRETVPETVGHDWYLGVALGYGGRSNPLTNGEDVPIHVVFDVAYYSEYFYFDNGELGLIAYQDDHMELSTLLTYTNEREFFSYLGRRGLSGLSDPVLSDGGQDPGQLPDGETDALDDVVDDAANEGGGAVLPHRKRAIELGLQLFLTGQYGNMHLQWLRDISSTFDGTELWLSYGYDWFYYGFTLSPSIHLAWRSQKFVGYYYGVLASEVNDERGIYQGASASSWSFNINFSYEWSEALSSVGSFEYTIMGDAIKASPIVEDSNVITWFLGIKYDW